MYLVLFAPHTFLLWRVAPELDDTAVPPPGTLESYADDELAAVNGDRPTAVF